MSVPGKAPFPGSSRDWLRHAASDLHLAKLALVDPDVLRNQIAFHAQQAVEKALKAVLVERQIHFPKTHDLEALIEILELARVPWPLAAEQLEWLTPFAVETRYPGGFAEVSNQEASDATAAAERVVDWARGQIK